MISKPYFSILSTKYYDRMLVILVILMYVAICAETDMYVPAFPQMIKYFNVAENEIQLILSTNFLGLCFASLISGPLADKYGRRNILIYGLFLFSISSLGCVLSTTFSQMLFFRLAQGISTSVPIIVTWAIFLDRYSQDVAGKLIGIVSTFTVTSIAFAPIIGSILSEVFGWRANFIVIFLLALVSFIGSFLFIEESFINKENNNNSVLEELYTSYKNILPNLTFIGYTLIASFPINSIIIYIANVSVIFINHMGLSIRQFGYYQAATVIISAIFSFSSVKLIDTKGLNYTKRLGLVLALFGAIFLYVMCMLSKVVRAELVCLSMSIIAAGSSLMTGIFSTKALSIFPLHRGAATSVMIASRNLLASILVILSEILFDGTIVPVAKIIFSYAIVSAIAYIFIKLSTPDHISH